MASSLTCDLKTCLVRGCLQADLQKGDCYDNAVMESFFSTLKSECVTGVYSNRAEARQSIFEYIEVWYDRQPCHSALGYQNPEAFEKSHVESNRESFKVGEAHIARHTPTKPGVRVMLPEPDWRPPGTDSSRAISGTKGESRWRGDSLILSLLHHREK